MESVVHSFRKIAQYMWRLHRKKDPKNTKKIIACFKPFKLTKVSSKFAFIARENQNKMLNKKITN